MLLAPVSEARVKSEASDCYLCVLFIGVHKEVLLTRLTFEMPGKSWLTNRVFVFIFCLSFQAISMLCQE